MKTRSLILLCFVFATPVILGKTSAVMSADFPGRACDLINEYLPGSNSMFFMAAAGHSQP